MVKSDYKYKLNINSRLWFISNLIVPSSMLHYILRFSLSNPLALLNYRWEQHEGVLHGVVSGHHSGRCPAVQSQNCIWLCSLEARLSKLTLQAPSIQIHSLKLARKVKRSCPSQHRIRCSTEQVIPVTMCLV